MRHTPFIAIAFVGLFVGLVSGFIINGLLRVETTLLMGLIGAALLPIIQKAVLAAEPGRDDVRKRKPKHSTSSSNTDPEFKPYSAPSVDLSVAPREHEHLGFRYLALCFAVVVICGAWAYYLMLERVPGILRFHDDAELETPYELHHAMSAFDRVITFWPIVLPAFLAPLFAAERYTKGATRRRARLVYSVLVSLVTFCFTAWISWTVLASPGP